jgi:hypothetical protein
MKLSGSNLFRSALLTIATSALFLAIPVFATSEFVDYRFPNTTLDGCEPVAGLVADSAGNLYGTAGCGTIGKGVVFELVRPVPPATAWTQQVLYNFSGGADGWDPFAPLAIDAAGNLYGTTDLGGHGSGVVFRLSPPATAGGAWSESVIYTFEGGSTDGAGASINGVVFDAAGNLYGTTMAGGPVVANNQICESGCGVVYELTPSATEGAEWTETVIHFFNYGQGATPSGNLALDSQGNLYGVASTGGRHGGGVAYRILKPTTPGGDWNYKVIYAFGATATDSAYPTWGLTFHGPRILYGTAFQGGDSNNGTVFQLLPPTTGSGPWTENVLHSFANNSDGAQPRGGVIFDPDGSLYGTTSRGGGLGTNSCVGGCGIVYELTPPRSGVVWSETVLHAFPASPGDGEVPTGGLLRAKNGVLLGVANGSGPSVPSKRGAIFGVLP